MSADLSGSAVRGNGRGVRKPEHAGTALPDSEAPFRAVAVAEAALRLSEARLSQAVEIARLGHWELDLATGVLTASDKCKANFGYRSDQPFGYEELLAAIHPDDRGRQAQVVREAIEKKADFDIEYRALTPDGEERWIDVRGRHEEGETGGPRLAGVSLDITERKQVERRLRESEERLARELADTLTLQEISMELIPERQPAAIYAVLLDAARKLMRSDAASVQILDPTNGSLRLLAFSNFHPDAEAHWQRVEDGPGTSCGYALQQGRRIIVPDIEASNIIVGEDLDCYRLCSIRAVQSTPLLSRSGLPLGMISTHWRHIHEPADSDFLLFDVLARQAADLIERNKNEDVLREREERQRFLLKLSDALRPLADPVAIQSEAARLVGEHLETSRAFYVEVHEDQGYTLVHRDHRTPEVSSLAGRHRLDDYGPAIDALRAGRTFIVVDTHADLRLSEANCAAYKAIGVGATASVPLNKEGRLVAIFGVHQSQPRAWTPGETALLEDVAERTWAAVERARAEAALRESEERYRTVFESIDEGFCVVEILFDEHGRPADYRFLEANATFERQTGLVDGMGKTALQLVPKLERWWIETYGRVALTGESVRFEHGSSPMGRQFEVYASRVGDETSRKVAIVFNDITDRKRAEQTQELLINELNHRVKNTLASVQAIAQHTLRRTRDPEEFVSSFAGRIQALSRVHSLLSDTNWRGADLQQLIGDQLLLGTIDEARIAAAGPSVHLPPQLALHVALMLHELGTNSNKYGALSIATGRISITWTVDDGWLRLRWTERGGPPVRAPISRGFGSTLIEQSAKGEGGDAIMSIETDGVAWNISLPLPHADTGPEVSTKLPADEAAEARTCHSRPAEKPAAPLTGKRFLVIEDEALVALDIIASLKEASAETAGPVSTIADALHAVQHQSFDAALLDGNLRGEPVDDIAAALTRRNIPFLFVTGYGAKSLPAGFAEAGVLGKPFTQEQLVEAAARLLDGAKPVPAQA